MHDFEWFASRLGEPAQVKSDEPGKRDWLMRCPVHNGSDSLHLEEMNGKAVLYCFHPTCDAHSKRAYQLVVDALDAEAFAEVDTQDTVEDTPAPPAIVVTRRRRTRPDVTPSGDRMSPLDWCAARCAMTREELDALELPLSERADRLLFEFPPLKVLKTRGVSEAKKKEITWEGGGTTPPLWPVPAHPPAEIIVTEGEFDAITLMPRYGEEFGVYSITGGAGNVPDQSAWEALGALGVRVVRVVFDADEAGRKGRESVLEAIREAGLQARAWRVAGLKPLLDEKDARDAALRLGSALLVELEEDIDEEDAVPLASVPSVPPARLWVDYVHPSEHTVLYGDGGTGKGVVAAWWVAQLVRDGKHVLVVDYEAHAQHEWRPRVERFLGGCSHSPDRTDRLNTHVHIVQPTKPVWEVQDWLRDQIVRTHAAIVVVDSVTYACVGMNAEESQTAVKYSMAINRLGVAVLSIAHVTKSDANPKHPFGSVYWSNGARVTVAVSRTTSAPDSPRLLKNWKSNQKHEEPDRQVDWSWLDGDLPCCLGVGDVKKSRVDQFTETRDEMDAEAVVAGRPLPDWQEILAELQARYPADKHVAATVKKYHYTDRPRVPTVTRKKGARP